MRMNNKQMNKPRFKRAILYARQHRANSGINETLHRLIEFLSAQSIDTYVTAETSSHFELPLPVFDCEKEARIKDKRHQSDLMIVVGGDGSLLSAARMAINMDIPVIGINRGRLGFLTDISPQEMEQHLLTIFGGDYQEESRSLLSMQLHGEQTTDVIQVALNDVVLNHGTETHLIAFDVYINQQFVSHYRADGLILATPTGSTAYALSAGGPIMHPHLNAMVMVPMFSHSLSSRPLVIDGDAQIQLKLCESNETNVSISCDGHESYAVYPGQWISIRKHPKQLRLLHPSNYNYYDTLRIKLGWGSQQEL